MAKDFALVCMEDKWNPVTLAFDKCRWKPDDALAMGAVRAHFETEHGTDEIRLELAVPCPRCHEQMTHLAMIGEDHHFECIPCHRARVVKQRQVFS